VVGDMNKGIRNGSLFLCPKAWGHRQDIDRAMKTPPNIAWLTY